MVAAWLANYMLAGNPNGMQMGKTVAAHFNDASSHKSHGRRIDRDEARQQGLNIEDLEPN